MITALRATVSEGKQVRYKTNQKTVPQIARAHLWRFWVPFALTNHKSSTQQSSVLSTAISGNKKSSS